MHNCVPVQHLRLAVSCNSCKKHAQLHTATGAKMRYLILTMNTRPLQSIIYYQGVESCICILPLIRLLAACTNYVTLGGQRSDSSEPQPHLPCTGASLKNRREFYQSSTSLALQERRSNSLRHDRDVLMPQVDPQIIVLVKQNFLLCNVISRRIVIPVAWKFNYNVKTVCWYKLQSSRIQSSTVSIEFDKRNR